MSIKIFKATFSHKDWQHDKCVYMPCRDSEKADCRAKEIQRELGAEAYKLEYQKDVEVM